MDFLELVKSRLCGPASPRRARQAGPRPRGRPPGPFGVQSPAVEVRGRPRCGGSPSTLVRACMNQRHSRAPVVVAGVGLTPDRVMRCDIPGDPVDLAIAMEHLALAATAEGLGTCWIGAFDQDQVREVLGIPESAKVVELMTLGYPAGSPRSKTASRSARSSATTGGSEGRRLGQDARGTGPKASR